MTLLLKNWFGISPSVSGFVNPLWPELSGMPLAAALIGALFVGTGVGFSLLTVILSGRIIGLIQKIPLKGREPVRNSAEAD